MSTARKWCFAIHRMYEEEKIDFIRHREETRTFFLLFLLVNRKTVGILLRILWLRWDYLRILLKMWKTRVFFVVFTQVKQKISLFFFFLVFLKCFFIFGLFILSFSFMLLVWVFSTKPKQILQFLFLLTFWFRSLLCACYLLMWC